MTTDSRHNLPVHPNLARTITPSGINQLWVADITYIRLRTEFVYLAVILDAFSVAAHSPPCFPQNVTPVDPVVQRMETPRLTLLGTHP